MVKHLALKSIVKIVEINMSMLFDDILCLNRLQVVSIPTWLVQIGTL